MLMNNVLKLEEDRYDCCKISSSSISGRVLSLLIDLHPIDHHLHRQILVQDFADPISPQRLIQDQIETLVKRPLNLIRSIQFRISKTSSAVDKEVDPFRKPLNTVGVERTRVDFSSCVVRRGRCLLVDAALLCMPRLLAEGIKLKRVHHVDLPAAGPATIHRCLRHHPDRRPRPFPGGECRMNFYLAVAETKLVC